MSSLTNLDLLSVGIAVAGIGILGFAVFFSDRRSITNQAFFLFAMLTIIWGISNYFNNQTRSPVTSLWVLRLHLLISTLHALSFFRLAYVFPNATGAFPKLYKLGLLPLALVTAVLTLTPLVFSGISQLPGPGQVANPDRGPGIAVFGFTAVVLVFGGLFLLIKKTIRTQGLEKIQLRYVLAGTVITFALIITFNLVLPIAFNQLRFIPLGAVFVFPFIAFTAYAIFKHHLLNVKVIATEILTFVLAVTVLFEAIFADTVAKRVVDSGIFALVLAFGILLIRSVLKEVKQREELAALNVELEAKRAQLEELSGFKSQILSLASHQIKSPLAQIKGFISILVDGAYGQLSEKVKETLGKMKGSADELINLINTLLDLRKVDEGKMDYQFARTDVVKIAQSVFEGLKPLAAEKKLNFTFTTPLTQAWVSADELKLKQVFQNISDNSIKYTPAGFVKLQLATGDKMTTSDSPLATSGRKLGPDDIVFSVSDSGLGISKDLLPHLFEEYIRDDRVKKQIRGTGLGLYVARKIVEAHGGELWAESDGEGKGSRFYVKLKKI